MKNVFRVIAIALIVTLTACGTPATEAVPAVPNVTLPTAAPDAAPAATATEICSNPYFPVKQNAEWVYSSTGSPSGSYEFSTKINEVRADGFSTSAFLKKVATTQNWECRADGLAPIGMIPNNATNILAIQRFSDVRINNVNGVFIPSNITTGMEWTYSFDIEGTQQTEGQALPLTGTVTQNLHAGNTEKISVPAGKFDAVAVLVETTIKVVVKAPSGDVKINLRSTFTYWYAPGVGWVKASGNGTLGGQDYFETIELVSFTAP